jgi:hypothetical protein
LPGDGLAAFRELGGMRALLAAAALILAAYCLIAASTELYAQPAPDRPDPEALAARERHQWPGLIPIAFLALIAGYAVLVAARRRRRREPGRPSTAPELPPQRAATNLRDTPSRSRRTD